MAIIVSQGAAGGGGGGYIVLNGSRLHCSWLFLTLCPDNECELAASWNFRFRIKISSALRYPQAHIHLSRRKELAGCPSHERPPLPSHPHPHLAARDCGSASGGEMRCSESRWASVASYWISARQQSGFSLREIRFYSAPAASPSCSSLLLLIAHHLFVPSVHRAALLTGSFPRLRCAARPDSRRHEAALGELQEDSREEEDREVKGIKHSDWTAARNDVEGNHEPLVTFLHHSLHKILQCSLQKYCMDFFLGLESEFEGSSLHLFSALMFESWWSLKFSCVTFN